MGVGARFSDLTIETRNGPRRVCVITPERDIMVSSDRLAAIRGGELDSSLDRAILEHLASGRYEAMVFRASNDDGSARYVIDPALDDEARLELITQLLRTHLRFFKEIEKHGLFAMVGVGFTDRDAADYERAADAIGKELTAQMKDAGVEAQLQIRIDQWLIERQAIWSAIPYDVYVKTKLPAALVAAERQHKSFVRLGRSADQ